MVYGKKGVGAHMGPCSQTVASLQPHHMPFVPRFAHHRHPKFNVFTIRPNTLLAFIGLCPCLCQFGYFFLFTMNVQ